MMIDASSPTVTRDKQGNQIAADDSYPQMQQCLVPKKTL